MEKNNGLQMLDDWGAAERNFFNEPNYLNYFEKVVSEQNGNIMEVSPLENSGNSNQSIFKDIAWFKEEKIKSLKEQLFDKVYENELLAFFQEHHRMMNRQEKKSTEKTIKKMISKGLIYVNDIGKIIVRKSNGNTPSKKKKKRK